MTAAYPLTWPDNIPRKNGLRDTGKFKTSLPAALKNVQESLRLFGADSGKPVSKIVLSSNVSLGDARPNDPGVAAWFEWEGQSVCIPVDRYSTVEANLQAIHHVVEARRVEIRHGTLALVRATMQGFKALPPAAGQRSWRAVLGLHPSNPITAPMVEAAFRAQAKTAHPDSGGSVIAMAELNVARDKALKEIQS